VAEALEGQVPHIGLLVSEIASQKVTSTNLEARVTGNTEKTILMMNDTCMIHRFAILNLIFPNADLKLEYMYMYVGYKIKKIMAAQSRR
jgi:hypothetical protein